MRFFYYAALVVAVAFSGCAGTNGAAKMSKWGREGARYMVAADHPVASKVGAKMLAKGGNVVDAAVATSFALAVVRPYSSGLGGGGFMIVHQAGEPSIVIDYRETAPGAAGPNRYLDEKGDVIPGKTVRGHWAVGVPGHVKGMAYALKHYGTMGLAEVLKPAIKLAWEGFKVDEHTHQAMVRLERFLKAKPKLAPKYAEIARIYLKEGEPYEVGDRLKQEDLSKTLRVIADGGAEAFYSGVIARRIIDDMKTHYGPMTIKDLKDYRVRLRTPLKGSYRGYEVVGMPPPSSGGACMLQILNVMKGFDPKEIGLPAYYHALSESMKHAFADRASYLGDQDFHEVVGEDVAKMISVEHAQIVRAAITPGKIGEAQHYGRHWLGDDSGTSHFSVIDAEGNAVAATETINLTFGSKVVPLGTGIVLNDELDDFTIKTGVPNEFGLMMSDRNLIKAGQRPLSSMSPTLLLKDGKAVLAAGASGGPRIITATLQTILQIVDFGKRPDAAVAAPRIHHQWSPDVLRYEMGLDGAVLSALASSGNKMEKYAGSRAGVCQVVYRDGGSIFGASDPRKGGRPAGR